MAAAQMANQRLKTRKSMAKMAAISESWRKKAGGAGVMANQW
jgi:hypothetical protein